MTWRPWSWGIAAAIYVPMLVESAIATRHEHAQRARGAVEPAADVYSVMRWAYPGVFAAMLLELEWRNGVPPAVFIAGVTVFACAKALKWWAIAALGPAWTFRVLVVRGARLVATGPYRFLRHPNYVAVVGELVGAALMTGAIVAGPTGMLIFGVLLKKRVAVEERALGRSL